MMIVARVLAAARRVNLAKRLVLGSLVGLSVNMNRVHEVSQPVLVSQARDLCLLLQVLQSHREDSLHCPGSDFFVLDKLARRLELDPLSLFRILLLYSRSLGETFQTFVEHPPLSD